MNRRTFIGTSAVASVGIAGMGLKCGGPSVSGVVTIITGAVAELRILFPAQETTLSKIVSLANSFNAAWVAGKFADAKTFFLNLDTLVSQVIADLGLNATTRTKLLLASLGVAVRTIAALISEQAAAQPEAMRAESISSPQTTDRVKKLADPKVADDLLKAVRP